jgi:hypothetical protein
MSPDMAAEPPQQMVDRATNAAEPGHIGVGRLEVQPMQAAGEKEAEVQATKGNRTNRTTKTAAKQGRTASMQANAQKGPPWHGEPRQ